MNYHTIQRIILEVAAWLLRSLTLVLKGTSVETVVYTLPDLTDTASITGAFPAGVLPLGATVKVDTAVTTDDSPPSNTFDVGIAGSGNDADAFGNDVAGAADTTTSEADFTADPTSLWSATAQDLLISPTSGNFLTGALTVQVTYRKIKAPE